MANLRCTECGRFVNDPWDHDTTCALYGMQQPTPPDVEAPVPADVEQPMPDPGETPTPPQEPSEGDEGMVTTAPDGTRYVDIRRVGIEAAIRLLEWHGGKRLKRPESTRVYVRMPGGFVDITEDDLLVRDTQGGWYRVHRRVMFPTEAAT